MSPQLSLAMEALTRGDDPEAERLLSASRPEGSERVAAAIGWYIARRPERAATLLYAAQSDPSGLVRVLAARMQADLCGELGWNHEARAGLERWLEFSPGSAMARRRLVDLLARSRAWEDAEPWLAGEHGRGLPLHRAGVLRELGRYEEAQRTLLALTKPSMKPSARRRLADLLSRTGAVDQSLDLLAEGGSRPGMLADRARLLLWKGEVEAAEEQAQAALDAGAERDDRDRAETALGAACLLASGRSLAQVVPGDPAAAEAVRRLDGVLARSPTLGEALIWRGHARAILGEDEAALADLDAGVPAVGGFDLGAAMLRHLIEQRRSDVPGFGARSLEELSEGLDRLGLRRAQQARIDTLPALAAAFGDAFRRLGGNRSGAGTVLRPGGEITALGPHLSPRSDARRALELVRTCQVPEVLARFDEAEARWPESSMGPVHRAELLLWVGRYEEAREAFERSLAINRFTRWGWIGQLANESFLGDPERALVLGDQGVEVMGGYGPSHYVYRGEALRRLGRRAEARAELEHAVDLGPSRFGARLTLALLCAEDGDSDGVAAHLPRLMRACAGMMATALEEEGAPTSLLWGGSPSCAELAPVLARAHGMMRGNRSSSCHTWFNAAGTLRLNEDRGDGGDPFRGRMRDRLEQAAAILAAGASPGD